VDAANRNALVAVFLKHLEYFSGIVFLTSNRVGVFDQAMKSRIHLALEYCPPEIEIRRRMWLQCLSAIPEDEIEFDPEEDVDYLIKDKVNGREIANAVNTARTLARWKKEKVGREHIEIVLGIRRDFDASIGKMSRELQHRESRVGTGGMVRQNSLAMSGIEEER
jgi:AAA+ superfamily predicted ATPase